MRVARGGAQCAQEATRQGGADGEKGVKGRAGEEGEEGGGEEAGWGAALTPPASGLKA